MKRSSSYVLAFAMLATLLSTAGLAGAQSTGGNPNPECLGSNCGTPKEERATSAETGDFFGAFRQQLASLFRLVFD
jgi:hypothetical protein